MATWDNLKSDSTATWQVMEEYMPKKLLLRYKNIFKEFDVASTGVINIEDVVLIVKECGRDISVDTIRKLLRKMMCCTHPETINHQFIDFSEFLVVMTAIGKNCIPEDEMLLIFQKFDEDGDGFISKQELTNFFSKIGENITDKELEEMIQEADVDGDGLVSYQEFVRLITNSHDNIPPEEHSSECSLRPLNDTYTQEVSNNINIKDRNHSDCSVLSYCTDDPNSPCDIDDNCFDSRYTFSLTESKKKSRSKNSLKNGFSWLRKSRPRTQSSSSCNFSIDEDHMVSEFRTLPRNPRPKSKLTYRSCENILCFSENSRRTTTLPRYKKIKNKTFSVENLLSLKRRSKRNASCSDLL